MAKKKIVFLTGSGMSVESGIPTFRGGGGLWDEYPVDIVATLNGYWSDPEFVLDFYNKQRVKMGSVEPCDGHRLIASLEKDYDVYVVTQNVDTLHEKAGSTNVLHLHGNIMQATSSRNPNDPTCIVDLPEDNPVIRYNVDKAVDGSQLRPYIVWFGEDVPNMGPAAELAKAADVFVVIGTSLVVYPAADLIWDAPDNALKFIIDPNEDIEKPEDFMHIVEGASEGMRQLIEILNSGSSEK